jgi:spore maturation protein CgeB
MRVVMFYHSLLSDWNHGNAHFLRGAATELIERGHQVDVYEPADAWSLQNLLRDHGEAPIAEFRAVYPLLDSTRYDPAGLDLDRALDDADLVLVHEWNGPELVGRIGEHRKRRGGYRLLFHDTHHRAASDPGSLRAYDLSGYDGVLAFGGVIRDIYLRQGWARRAWTWHEAADTRIFRPLEPASLEGDLVWIGNWGDDERTGELQEFLLAPVKELGLRAVVYGVRYPEHALAALEAAGIEHRGWLPNYRVPEVFSRFKVTVHVPRRPYAEALPGIPTIRPFEALACGIPLVSAPWEDAEGLFAPGKDYLVARDGAEMTRHLQALIEDPRLRRELAGRGRRTILACHTCAHRVDELLEIYEELSGQQAAAGGCSGVQVFRCPGAADGQQSAVSSQRSAVSGQRSAATTHHSPLTTHQPRRPTLRVAFFGSSLVSAYWNGAATYYRGIIRALHERGHRVTFYEPDAYERQQHRDIPDPEWARVVVYSADGEEQLNACLEEARAADLIVKASGVGVFDELLEAAVLEIRRPEALVAFWDVDAPATLDRVQNDRGDPFRALVPRYDLVLTYGGGDPVVNAYTALGARACVPVYNGLDPATHHPVAADPRFEGELGFLGNRLPDREARVEEFFIRAAAEVAEARFLLGGSGWEDKAKPPNVRHLGHVYTRDHNAFNCTPRAVLNISRESMARYGFSPATRVFEAAGAGACLITDYWEGIEGFLEPEQEVLVARSGCEVAEHVRSLDPKRARSIGQAALRRVLAEHTYAHRAEQLEALLLG